MDAIKAMQLKANAIRNAINSIKSAAYRDLGYPIENWILSLEQFPNLVSHISNARIHVFNTTQDPLVNKHLLLHYGLIRIEDIQGAVNPDIAGFLVLRFPMALVPELDDALLENTLPGN